MTTQNLKEFVQSLPTDREEALELYQDLLRQQNESTGDEFYQRQEVCDAVEVELARRGYINPRSSCFPSH